MKRLANWVAVIVVGVGSVLVGTGSPACACSCASLTEKQAYDQADVVFAATLARRDEPTAPIRSSTDPATLSFTVDAVYKGTATPTQLVQTAMEAPSCGLDVQLGKRYLVYADTSGAGLEASLCGGTRDLAGTPDVAGAQARPVVADAKESGAVPPVPEQDVLTKNETSRWIWLVPAAGLVALALAAFVVVRRRRTG